MSDLHMNFCGLEFINPFIVAASPSSDGLEKEIRALEEGWAGIVFKTVSTNNHIPKLAEPNMGALPYKNQKQMAFYNYDLISERSIEDICRDIQYLKERFPDRILCASIMAGNAKEWEELITKLEAVNVDMIECSMSCPQGDKEGKIPITDEELLKKTVRQIKGFIKKNTPLIVKMTPNITDIAKEAEAALCGGADSICAIDTVRGFVGIDIQTGKPKLNVNGKATFGGLSGPAIKPIALGAVAKIKKENSGCQIAGVGGISNYEDALEFIMLGCKVVEICSAISMYGFSMVKTMCKGLEQYLEQRGIAHLSDLTGIALEHIVTQEELDRGYQAKCIIDYDKCVNCQRCVVACQDCGFGGLSVVNNQVVMTASKCKGCGVCATVCTKNCITLEEITPN